MCVFTVHTIRSVRRGWVLVAEGSQCRRTDNMLAYLEKNYTTPLFGQNNANERVSVSCWSAKRKEDHGTDTNHIQDVVYGMGNVDFGTRLCGLSTC